MAQLTESLLVNKSCALASVLQRVVTSELARKRRIEVPVKSDGINHEMCQMSVLFKQEQEKFV